MKRNFAIILFLVWTTSGCTGTWSNWFDTRSVTAPINPTAHETPLPSGPITADVVEPGNAHRVADACWDEIAREEAKDSSVSTKDTKKR
jgi:hypothetical protein